MKSHGNEVGRCGWGMGLGSGFRTFSARCEGGFEKLLGERTSYLEVGGGGGVECCCQCNIFSLQISKSYLSDKFDGLGIGRKKSQGAKFNGAKDFFLLQPRGFDLSFSHSSAPFHLKLS